MRQGLHVIRNLSRRFSEFSQTALDLRWILLELVELQSQQRESLVDVVVKLPRNPGAFLLLRFN